MEVSRRLVIAGLLTAAIAGLAGSPVWAGESSDFSISVGPSAVDVGQSFEVSASGPGLGCSNPPGPYEVTLTLRLIVPGVGDSQVLGALVRESLDPVSVPPKSFTAPSEPGTYEITGTWDECSLGFQTDTATLIVNATTTTTTTKAPPTSTTTTAPPTTTTTIAAAVAPTAPSTTLTAELPATGQTTDGLVWAALAALLAGSGLVTFAARRS